MFSNILEKGITLNSVLYVKYVFAFLVWLFYTNKIVVLLYLIYEERKKGGWDFVNLQKKRMTKTKRKVLQPKCLRLEKLMSLRK